MRGAAISRRERAIVACLVDAVAGEPLPPPPATDAVAAFDRFLAASPAVNRAGLRGLLWALELAPLAGPWRRRLRRLGAGEREAYLDRLERGRLARPAKALLALVKLAYYGDDGVMARLGYDPEPVLARGRRLRAAEGRW